MTSLKLKNKTIVITGGSGFLGSHLVHMLQQYGASVFNFDIKEGFDVRDKSALQKIANDITTIDVLINCACNNPKIESGKGFYGLEDIDINILFEDLAVGLIGATLSISVIGSKMAEQKHGSIINIGSDLGLIGPDQRLYDVPKPVSYSIAKSGLVGLTKYTATYWADRNVRCNYVAFGGIYNSQPKEFVDKLCKLIPLGRMADISDYDGIIKYLASDESQYMTGAVISVDGGRTTW